MGKQYAHQRKLSEWWSMSGINWMEYYAAVKKEWICFIPDDLERLSRVTETGSQEVCIIYKY